MVRFTLKNFFVVSTWQVEMGWPDIHWLAWDKGGLVAAVLSLA
jgi:hypothetical protein